MTPAGCRQTKPRYNEAMLLANPEIDEVALAKLVAEHYGADPTKLAFVPVGGDV